MYIQLLGVIIGSHNLFITGCYVYIPDEVFHDWKLIHIKEEDIYSKEVVICSLSNQKLVPEADLEGSVRPPPLKFAKHMLCNVN